MNVVLDEAVEALADAIAPTSETLAVMLRASLVPARRARALQFVVEAARQESRIARLSPRREEADVESLLEEALRLDRLALAADWLQMATLCDDDAPLAEHMARVGATLIAGCAQKPDALPPSEPALGMSYVVCEQQLYFGPCVGSEKPDCACVICSRWEALICRCGGRFLDHGCDPYGLESTGCTAFSLASWQGGPPAPPLRLVEEAVPAAPVEVSKPKRRTRNKA